MSPRHITSFEPITIVAYPDSVAEGVLEGVLYVQTMTLGSGDATPSSIYFDMWQEPLSVRREREQKEQNEARDEKMRETLGSWVGHTKTELLEQWGPPTQIIANKGQDVLVYDNSVQMTLPVGSGSQRIGLNVKSEKYVMFWMDREDRISKVTWKGQ